MVNVSFSLYMGKHPTSPKNKSGGSRKENADKTRERILRAALNEFASRGFSGARMEAIARKAKANKAMIHYYFGNKQALYRSLLELIFAHNELEQGLDQALPTWDLTIPQQLYVILFVMTGMHIERHTPEQRDIYRVMAWENAEGQNNIRLLAEEFIIPRLQKIATLLTSGIEQGIFAPVHPWLFLYGIISRILFYTMQQDLYKGTTIYNQLYGNINREIFFRFLSESVFRELSLPGKPLAVPELPADIMQKLTELVDQLRKNHLSFTRT